MRLLDYRDVPEERALRQDRERRHVRARRARKPGGVLRQDRAAAAAGRAGPEPRHHPQRARAGRARQRHRRIHRPLRVPGRRAHAHLAGDRRDVRRRASRAGTSKACGRTTRRRCGTGWSGWRRTAPRRSRRWARSSTASGASTWRARRSRSSAAGCRSTRCSRASPVPSGALELPETRDDIYAR